MKQMVAPNAPVLARSWPFNNSAGCFMRDDQGKIFFLKPVGGGILAFPLLEDGTLAEKADLSHISRPSNPNVTIIDRTDLGIKDFDEFFRANRINLRTR